MKAVVLTYDANHFLTDHMIDCYQSLWPSNPLQFLVPYQAYPKKLVDKYDDKIIPIKTPKDIKACMDTLLANLPDNEWVYWCIDDKYPLELNIQEHEAAFDWVRTIDNKNVAGISMCRARGWLEPQFLTMEFLRNNHNQVFLERLDNRHSWLHQFVRVKVLKTLFSYFPNEPFKAKEMDYMRPIVPNKESERLFVSEYNRIILAESAVDGKITMNCVKSLRAKGIEIPEEKEKINEEIVIGSSISEPNARKSIRRRLEGALYSLGLRLYPREASPKFIVIGAQKAGTTWLYHCLKDQSGIQIPESKELHYFDIESRFSKSFKSYLKNFDSTQISGELTPAYSILSENRIAYMHKLIPDTKLIMVLRNPIERAWSHALMDLCKNQLRTVEDVPKIEFLNHFNSKASILRGDYQRTISLYRKYFSKNVLIVYYEEIISNPEGFILSIAEHIGMNKTDIQLDSMPLRKKIFTSGASEIPEYFKKTLEVIYRKKIINLKSYLNAPELDW